MLGKRRGRRGNGSVKKSPNIVKEVRTSINGKPAVMRVYKKAGKYGETNYVATVVVGKAKMTYKRPRLGFKIKKKRGR